MFTFHEEHEDTLIFTFVFAFHEGHEGALIFTFVFAFHEGHEGALIFTFVFLRVLRGSFYIPFPFQFSNTSKVNEKTDS